MNEDCKMTGDADDDRFGKSKYHTMMTLEPPDLDDMDLDDLDLPDINQLPTIGSLKKEESK